jgi:hypothetical protein
LEKRIRPPWTAGRADPRVAGELDRFMAAAERRLGEEGMRNASRAAGLDVLARSFKLGREGTEQSAAWGNRLGREAKVAERERTRQEERQRQGLPREQERKGLGLSR